MNKSSLLTQGLNLNGEFLVFTVYDLEPSGILVQAYHQESSKEYLLPITERELVESSLDRSKESLQMLLQNIYFEPYGLTDRALQTNYPTIKKQKKRPSGDEVQAVIRSSVPGEKSVHEVLCSGLVELCKNKPNGLEAVKWLGEWLLANNPRKPRVEERDD